MKKSLLYVVICIVCFAFPPCSAQTLDSILDSMDRAAANFRTADCDFSREMYQKVIDETDKQTGVTWFRLRDGDLEMAVDVLKPDKKQILFMHHTLAYYQESINQITEYRSTSEWDSLLVLGFGGRGHDLPKSYEMKLVGFEDVQGLPTARLELVPKSQRLRNTFRSISLWIDPTRGVSIMQRLDEPSGDWTLVTYTNINLNRVVPPNEFVSKANQHTKIVKPTN